MCMRKRKIPKDCELVAYHWAMDIDHNSIYHRYDNFYVVPSSNAKMTTSQGGKG
jgi:hypothetical protein